MVRFLFAIAAFTLAFWSSTSEAKKVALIIGNSDYQLTSPLTNPSEDAKLILASAKKAGFDVVTLALDLQIGDFQKVLRNFRQSADGAEVAMVYYAGHGIEGQGKNWLIPVDAELGSARDLPYEAVNLDRVLETIAGAKIRIVVLDACRNNPFARTWKSSTRSVTNGLAGMDIDDFLVIYAAAPGQTAADGTGKHSPFATSLAKRLPQPDLPVQLLGGTVRDDVLAATGGDQRPFVSASITGTPIYLVPRTRGLAPVAAPTAVSNAPNLEAIEDLTWQGAMSAASVSAYSAYLSQFPKGKYAVAASRKISESLGLATAAVAGAEVAEVVDGAETSIPAVGALSATKFGKYVLSDISIECVKLSGFFGLPDQLFLSFEGGDRFPQRGTKPYNIKKGESWVIKDSLAFEQLASFRVMEHDPIGGHDVIGTIDIGTEAGTFTKTMNGDKSEYKITYTLAIAS